LQYLDLSERKSDTNRDVSGLTSDGTPRAKAIGKQGGLANAQVETSNYLWVWTFTTHDAYFSGFAGDAYIEVKLAGGRIEKHSIPHPGDFVRGRTNLMTCKSLSNDPPVAIILSTQYNFFGDQWRVKLVACSNPNTNVRWSWDYAENSEDGLVPDKSNASPYLLENEKFRRFDTSEPRASDRDPDNVVVYVWTTNLPERFGHVSMQLGLDGTWISWWPEDYDTSKVKYLEPYDAIAVDSNRTYSDDVLAEGGDLPDYAIALVGLDQNGIKKWWQAFAPSHKYSLAGYNCAHTVRDGLWNGGAGSLMNSVDRQYYEAEKTLWTPGDVLGMVETMLNCPA
jgi:hypothetical protein